MKKVFLAGIMVFGLFATISLTQAKTNDDPAMHCVATCIAVYCGDHYANMDVAIEVIDRDQDECEAQP